MKTFNIYCDESCHLENDHKPFMFLGYISCAYPQIRTHTERINEIKKKHNFYAEIKWNKVNKTKLKFYLELIDYFFSTDLRFRAIGVEKSKVRLGAFGKTYDEHYYTMYYYLLNHQLNMKYTYNVYLDIKDTLSANKVDRLKKILNVKFGVFRNVQNIISKESLLLQLADLIIGAISYNRNEKEKKSDAKRIVIDRIKKHCNLDLEHTNYDEKLNLFFIELR
ncbi:hypothetical protein DSECCO2_226740 [anaerobic digester metagenome]